jgi:alkylation response protein AidB-like acyl-CoA dehydrogenase
MTAVDTEHQDTTEDGDAGDQGTGYRAPISDIALALEVAGLQDLLRLDAFSHADPESVQFALEEFGRLAADVIAPSDRIGDRIGSRLLEGTGTVRTPEAFHHAYGRYVEGGWGALPFPLGFGGGGLPSVVGLAIGEMFASANMALSLNPVLTQGAIEALLQWGSQAQQETYLPKLLTGEWTGTMNLTEPDAGSDLGEIRTRAEQDDSGRWRVTGTKVFITWGEHDLADNVIHLVLARTPGSPAGSKGLSLFVVPKHLLASGGGRGERNTLQCLHLEHKLGIHGSPTCVMEFDGATGELVGPLHGGMRAMFTMMNAARLSIGVQGPAVAERAFQQARDYAAARLQGRADGVAPPNRSAIIEHPDVRQMLLTMTTTTQASRLLLYVAKAHGDRAHHGGDAEERERSRQFCDLLTPIAKAWSTDVGFQATSLGVQVLGGAGYIEESGMAQRLRDARISPIYEGTNGIQALDLVARKLPRDGGRWMWALLDEAAASIPDRLTVDHPLAEAYSNLTDALGVVQATTGWMLGRLTSRPEDAVAGATSYLELLGITLGGWLMAERARVAVSADHPDASRIVAECNFFALEILGRSAGLARPILAGARHLDVPIGDGTH